MKTDLLELLLSLSSAGSSGEKAVNQTLPAQPPAIVAPSKPEAKKESKPTVEEETALGQAGQQAYGVRSEWRWQQ